MTRGVFKRRDSPTTDPNLPFISTDHDRRKSQHYRKVLNSLVFLIYEHITPFVNWNHTAIPSICKTDLPLRFEGQHMDISFILPDGTMAFIQLHVIDPEKVAKKWRRIKWQSPK